MILDLPVLLQLGYKKIFIKLSNCLMKSKMKVVIVSIVGIANLKVFLNMIIAIIANTNLQI